jgi:serine/threonine-protein kinase RsbW
LQLRVRAEATAVPQLRERMHAWLTALAWPPNQLHDLLMATTEACANAVEHAYRPAAAGEMMIGLRVVASGNNRRRAVIVVRDWGRWRPVVADRGNRGHGLTLIRRCVDDTRVRRDLPGTSVTMISVAVPALAAVDARSNRPATSPLLPPSAAAPSRPALSRAVADRRDERAAAQHRAAVLCATGAELSARAVAARRRARELITANAALTTRAAFATRSAG